jgi:aryl-alcohol dehydrogenase-like predicted oxidoreductase
LRRAREIGVRFLDSSDAYGQGRNEELIPCAVRGYRSEYVIASKFGILRARRPHADRPACGNPFQRE